MNKAESYIPSNEEIKDAEESMTPEQKKASEELEEIRTRELNVKTRIDEGFNNRGENIYTQVLVEDKNVIYEGWGQSIFEDDGIIYRIDNSGAVMALPRDASAKLLETRWARGDYEDKALTGNEDDYPYFPDGEFRKIGAYVPKERVKEDLSPERNKPLYNKDGERIEPYEE
jgi:hypothetical protein